MILVKMFQVEIYDHRSVLRNSIRMYSENYFIPETEFLFRRTQNCTPKFLIDLECMED